MTQFQTRPLPSSKIKDSTHCPINARQSPGYAKQGLLRGIRVAFIVLMHCAHEFNHRPTGARALQKLNQEVAFLGLRTVLTMHSV